MTWLETFNAMARYRALPLVALLWAVMAAAQGQEPRKAAIIDYGSGDRGLQWVEGSTGEGSGSARAPERPPVQPRTSGVPVSRGGGGSAYGARGSSVAGAGGPAAGGGDEPADVMPGEGVELIVGGQGKDGIAKKARVPVLK